MSGGVMVGRLSTVKDSKLPRWSLSNSHPGVPSGLVLTLPHVPTLDTTVHSPRRRHAIGRSASSVQLVDPLQVASANWKVRSGPVSDAETEVVPQAPVPMASTWY